LLSIQGVRHYQGNPAFLEAVKDSIEARFVSAGLQTFRHAFQRPVANYTGHNIIGRKPGMGEEQTVFIIDAHFDSVQNGPGADDNGSGVVGFLEALRVLAPYNFERTIKFIGFDFEESVGVSGGLYGSRQYVQTQLQSWETIAGVVNFEMIGYYSEQPNSQQIPTGFNILFPNEYNTVAADSFRGNFIVNVGDTESQDFTLAFDSLTRQYVPDLKIVSLTLPSNGLVAPDFRRSDHANFWDIDVPALMITDGANFRNTYYHTPNDSVSKLNFTFMSRVVKGAVATIAALAGIQHSSYADADVLPASVTEQKTNCEIEVFPIAVRNVLTVKTGGCFTHEFILHLMNAEGKTILTRQESNVNETQINFTDLPCGVYLLMLQDGKHRAVKKVIVG
jgi:Zn-dependent M28 family amino/carboxypeptidase